MRKTGTRLLAVLLAVVMVLPSVLIPGMAAEATGFTDVPEGSWYADAVNYVSEKGYMTGVGDNRFAPNDEVTRAMFVTILARITMAETDGTVSAFKDVPLNKWYTGAVSWAAENGIVNGVGNGMFAPGKSITRQDLCTILYRFVNAMDYELTVGEEKTFTDSASVSSYAAEAVRYASSVGLIAGYDDGTFRPKATATRAQMAVIIMRLARLLDGQIVKPDPMPAQSFNGEGGNGMAVSIEAPEGAFPEGTEMSVSAIENLQSIRVLEKLARTGTVYAASDISFTKKGETLQPNAPVQVQLSVAGLQDVENPAVVHVKHDGTVEYVDAELVSLNRAGTEKAMKFEATDFSVYAVVNNDDQNRARLKVQLWKSALVEGSYTLVKDGDPVYVTRQDIDNLASIIPDGETPIAASGEMFCGWFYDDGAFNGTNVQYDVDDADGLHTMAAARDQVKARLQSAEAIVDDETTVHIYPMLLKYFNIVYVDENGATTLNTETKFSKESSIRYEIYQLYTPNERDYRFIGWQKDDGDDTVYQNHAEVTISKTETTIRAQVQQGYWLTFEENPGNSYKGATYNAPIFCPYGNIPSNAMPTPNPTLAGYDFEGWYTTYNNGTWSNRFNFNGTISQDTTLYAKWKLKSSVPYTVIVWRQNLQDDKNAADSAKTYDFAFATTLTAAPNTPISSLDLSYFQTTHTWTYEGNNYQYYINSDPSTNLDDNWYYFKGFKYNTTKGVVSASADVNTVLPNGTTTLNLYWDRELVTYNFRVQGYTSYSESTMQNYFSSYTWYGIGSDGNFHEVKQGSYSSGSGYYYYCQVEEYENLQHASGLNENNDTRLYWFVYNNSTYYVYFDTVSEKWVYYNYQTPGTTNEFTEAVFNQITLNEDFPAGATYFIKSNSSTYITRSTYTGLYEQPLSKYGYAWPTDFRWDWESTSSGQFVSFTGYFNVEGTSTWTVNFLGESLTSSATANHYLESVNGTYASVPNHQVPCKTSDGMVFRGFLGFSADQFRVKLPSGVSTYYVSTKEVENAGSTEENPDFTFTWGSAQTTTSGGYTNWIDSGHTLKYSGFTPNDNSHYKPLGGEIEFHYSRNKYRINYMVGKYKDGNGQDIEGPMTGQLKQSAAIYFEDSVDSYKVGGTNYYDPVAAGDFTDESFIFAGWYADSACTTAYDFTGKSMPVNGITVYAKFVQREYRVFLEPNFPDDPNFKAKWAESSQDMNFRVNYLGQISDGQPINCSDENGNYVLVGWYHDAACTDAYNFATRLTDEIADDYDKTVDMTDPPDATHSSAWNSDVNRPWINKKVVIYAKWRKVLSGANGITVKYDAIEQENVAGHTGTFVEENDTPTDWEDPLRYMDTATAYARSGSTPDLPKDWQFLYWEILDKDGSSTGITKYPGQEFTVDAKYAVEKDITVNPDYGTRGGSNLVPVKAGDFSNVTSDLVVTAQYEQNSSQGQGHWEWKPVSTIIPDEEYLIGWVKDGVTYLAVNYNESATNHYYYSLSSGGYNHYFGYTAVATIENNLVVGCAGNATNLDYCTWTFSSSTGGTITSGSDSNRYLAAYSSANYHDLYPAGADTNAQNWIWNADAKTLTRSIGGTTMYAQYSSLNGSGNYMGMYEDTEGEYVQLYHKEWVEDQVTVKHTVTFIDGYTETIIAAHEVEDGAAMPATPATPDHSDDNYQFVRWDPADPSTYTTVTDDLTFTAIYEFSQTGYYLVTFKDWNGRVLSTQTVAEGESATAPANPTRTGYNFTGWDKDYSSITQNLVVYATYSKTVSKSYTVTLRAVYGPKEPLKRTHVTWYANNGTTVTAVTEGETTTYTGDGVVYKNSNEVVINNGIDIEDQSSWANLTYEGATFLGWARLPEMADQVNANTPWFNGKFTTANVLDLGSDPENPTYTNKIIAYEGLSEKDLWLVYDAATNTFTAHDRTYNTTGEMLTDTVTVTGLTNNQVKQIAANERTPYHGLYAVWKRDVFYIVHSSTGVMEAVSMPIDNTNGTSVNGLNYKVGTADLTSFVQPGYLYGGYYTDKNNDGLAYGYVEHAAVQAVADAYTASSVSEGWTALPTSATSKVASPIARKTISGFHVYDGSSLYTNGTNKAYMKDGDNYVRDENGNIKKWPAVWTAADAETVNGKSMTPVANKVYYLKEVSSKYLTSKIIYTYDTTLGNKIIDVYLLSLYDDGNYQKDKAGFYVNVGGTTTNTDNFKVKTGLSTSFTLVQQAGVDGDPENPVATTVTAENFGLTGGAVLVTRMTELATDANIKTFTMLPTWTTPDGVEVRNNGLTFNFNEEKNELTWNRSFDGTEKMYIDVAQGMIDEQPKWGADNAVVKVKFYKENGTSESNSSEWVLAEKTGIGDIRVIKVPAGDWKYFQIGRFPPDGTNNYTGQMPIRSSATDGANSMENFVTKFSVDSTKCEWGHFPN